MTPTTLTLPATLRPSPVRGAILLCGCLVFVAIGVLMVRGGDSSGYFIGGFFALGLPILALRFYPRATYLRLTTDDFTFCSLFRAHTVRWDVVAAFGVTAVGRHRMVAWNFVPGYPRTGRARALSQAISGYEAALPDTYGYKAAKLADLMNDLCQQYGRAETL